MYAGYIVELKDGRLHPNANKLKIWNIFDTNVITDLSYNDGDVCVYFPSDGQLSEEYCKQTNLVKKYKPVSECSEEELSGKSIVTKDGIDCINIGGYMDPEKRNVQAIRLRGEKSDGILMPIETLSNFGDVNTLKIGMCIIDFNGHEICRKYIPKKRQQKTIGADQRLKKNKKELKYDVRYPYFMEHKDTEQLAYNQSAFHEGDTIYLTRKIHGTSQRSGNTIRESVSNGFIRKLFKLRPKITKDYGCVSGTRRTTLRSYNGGFYGNNEFRYPYHEFFNGVLPKGMEVYYEIAGWVNENTPIMSSVSNSKVKDKGFLKQYGETTTFTYGCEPGKSRMFVYRITMTNEDGVVVELPTEACMKWCERFGCEFVPVLDKFIYTTWEDLNERIQKWLDIPEPLADGQHIVEGVVVRIDNRLNFTAYKAKSYNFKVLEGIIKDEADAPDIEEAEELIMQNEEY